MEHVFITKLSMLIVNFFLTCLISDLLRIFLLKENNLYTGQQKVLLAGSRDREIFCEEYSNK